MCAEHGDCVSKRPEKGGGGVLTVLVVINHLGARYPLTLALFDLDRSKMAVLK